jgi:hypothetical protein
MCKTSKKEAEKSMLSWIEIGEIVTPLSWLPPPSTLTLSSSDAHVWLARLDPPAISVQQIKDPGSKLE